MSILSYPNMTMANLSLILGDYNAKFTGMLSFWFIVTIIIGIILFNNLSRLTFGVAAMATMLVLTLISLPLAALGLLAWGIVVTFATLFVIFMFIFFMST